MKKIQWGDFIHSDPGVLLGKPVIKGTRLSVEFILGLFAEGWTEDQILENYPNLTKDGLLAVTDLPSSSFTSCGCCLFPFCTGDAFGTGRDPHQCD
jgi:uncharacterized protein (DUF433 family)